MTDLILQFLPLMTLQLIYAAIVYALARKRRINPWPWTIATLVPFLGIFVFPLFFLVTLLSVLDRLNVLEAQTKASS